MNALQDCRREESYAGCDGAHCCGLEVFVCFGGVGCGLDAKMRSVSMRLMVVMFEDGWRMLDGEEGREKR